MAISSVAILGAGNGGVAAAADLTNRGFEVRLYGRTAATLAPLLAQGGIAFSGSEGEGFAQPALITGDPGEAMAGADLVVMMAPTQAHEAVATLLAPHLTPSQILLAAPGHTLLLIPNILRRLGVQPAAFCDTASLPYICRKTSPAEIRITQAAKYLVFAAFPGSDTARLHALLLPTPVFPSLRAGANLLETVFPYTNAIHHPPATLLNAGRIEATQGDYYHYYDGVSPSVGRVIDALDKERQAVAAALGARLLPFPEQFYRAGYTTEAARDSGLAYEAFHQSAPDRLIRASASLDHRFLDEDVPFGLVPLSELGRLAGVATPRIDHLIHLAEVATGKNYRVDGLTLARMGLAGLGRQAAATLLTEGFPEWRDGK